MAAVAQSRRIIHIMIAMNESTIVKQHGPYKPASISSRSAFEWVLNKIVRSNVAAFRITLLNVQVAFERDKTVRQRPTTEEKARAMEMLTYFTEKCRDIELPCEVMIEKGDPKNVICRETKRVMPDILILGSRGVDRLSVPSVSYHVRNNSARTVIVVKRAENLMPRNRAQD